MTLTSENYIEKFLPQYLNDNYKEMLASNLANFPNNMDKIYMNNQDYLNNKDSILQSDIFEYKDESLNKPKRVLVISNTCDNSGDNKRDFPLNIACVPLIKLQKLLNCLRKNQKKEDEIIDFEKKVKSQKYSNLLFFPKINNNDDDYIACFDKPFSEEREQFNKKSNKLMSLSNYGFYIFLLKLSIHFTRILEKINRG